MRIKSKWHKKDKPKSLEEVAGALGFIAWRAAHERADKMYNAGFNFASKGQLLAVVGEYVAFLLQLADRLAYGRLDEQQRPVFVGALAKHLINTMVENLTDDFGPGEYREAFVDKLNERMEAYADFEYDGDQPGYQALRYLGNCIDEVMGSKDNKWVTEQVVEIEAPEVIKNLKKGFNDLLGQWETTPAA